MHHALLPHVQLDHAERSTHVEVGRASGSSAERFMRASAWDAFQDRLGAFAVAMALFGTPPADLCLGALVGFVAGDFLAVEALIWALPSFEGFGEPRFPAGIEESLLEEASRIWSPGEVYHH